MFTTNKSVEEYCKPGDKIVIRKHALIKSLHPQEPEYFRNRLDRKVVVVKVEPALYDHVASQRFAPHRRRKDKFLTDDLQLEESIKNSLSKDIGDKEVNSENIHSFFGDFEKIYCYRENVNNHYFNVHYCCLKQTEKIYWVGRGGYWYYTDPINIKNIFK